LALSRENECGGTNLFFLLLPVLPLLRSGSLCLRAQLLPLPIGFLLLALPLLTLELPGTVLLFQCPQTLLLDPELLLLLLPMSAALGHRACLLSISQIPLANGALEGCVAAFQSA
jgi:hypothetical protein